MGKRGWDGPAELGPAFSDGYLNPFAVMPAFSDKLSFLAKIFHSWTQPKGKFILESLSQILLRLEF